MIDQLKAAGIAQLDHESTEDALIGHLITLQAIFDQHNPKDESDLAAICTEAGQMLNHIQLSLKELQDEPKRKPVRKSRSKPTKTGST